MLDNILDWFGKLKPIHYLVTCVSALSVFLVQKFGSQMLSISGGFFESAGGWIWKHLPFLKNKKKKGTNKDMVTIARLSQKVTDLQKNMKEMAKKQNQTDKRLEACQGERQECRSDLKNLANRVAAIEFQRKQAI